MGDWTPLYVSLAILFIIGGIIPLVVSPFVDVSVYNQESFISPIIEFARNGFTVGSVQAFGITIFSGLDFNPFTILGESFHDFLLDQLGAFSYIPNYIAIPLLIICFVGFVYTIVKLLPTT